MKIMLTVYVFLSLLCFSSCVDIDFSDLQWPSGSYGPGGYTLSPVDIERINLDPGYLSADSIDYTTEDQLTVYGHLTPYMNRKISVSELGIILSDEEWNINGGKRIVFRQNEEWIFHKDTALVFSFTINDVPINQKQFASYYIVVKNTLEGTHINEFYEYNSAMRLDVSNFTVKAINDSVTFLGNSKAILWSHLMAKKDCEIISVRFLWGTNYAFQNVDTVATSQYLIKNIPMVISDTISILPRNLYQWSTSAHVKFEDESNAFSSVMVSEFVKE
jgi:hypothetical protein